MSLEIQLNGVKKSVEGLNSGASLADVITALALKSDRVAVERNGDIARRAEWGEIAVSDGDRLEIVHFVGGGTASEA